MDPSTRILLLALIVGPGALLLWYLAGRLAIARIVRERAFEAEPLPPVPETRDPGSLRRWLARAGLRGPPAAATFVAATILGVVFSAIAVAVIYASGSVELLRRLMAGIPGGVGELMIPFVYASPWILGAFLSAAPWLTVRRLRQRRVSLIEQDLPLACDLLAALSTSGVGFDTALARIQKTRLRGRPLGQEFGTFQADLLAGRPRVDSLRRLDRRIDIPAMSVFVSALVQAEQMGMGYANVLRRQADDMRDRRRERANAFAMTLPVKRLVPMVFCFLPGIFVWAIGPVMIQFLQMLDNVLGAR